jgi:hypothetical protein
MPAALEALHPRLSTARALLRRTRDRPVEIFASGVEKLDRLLGGGLRRGELIELVGGRSSGRFSTVLASLAAVSERGDAAALIDLGDHLSPHGVLESGAALERILWVRPTRLKEALLSTEMVLQSGFPLVVVDLGSPPVPGGRGAEAVWIRLTRAARDHRSALLVSSPYRATGTAACRVLECRPAGGAWEGGRGAAPRLLRATLLHEILDARPEGVGAAASAPDARRAAAGVAPP